MRESYIYADFPASFISERVVTAVSALSARKLIALTDAKALIVNEADIEPYQMLTYRNLRWQYLSDYALACNKTAGEFLYGDKHPIDLEYSYFDEAIIPLINLLPANELKAAAAVIRATYPSPKFKIGNVSPSQKIISVALMGSRLPEDVSSADARKYRTNINEVLSYFRKARVKERCILHIDYIPDLSAYFRVSPHWAFSLKIPLFCKTAEADDFFDLFCLLPRQQQLTVLAMLLTLCVGSGIVVPRDVFNGVQDAIDREGGIVL